MQGDRVRKLTFVCAASELDFREDIQTLEFGFGGKDFQRKGVEKGRTKLQVGGGNMTGTASRPKRPGWGVKLTGLCCCVRSGSCQLSSESKNVVC